MHGETVKFNLVPAWIFVLKKHFTTIYSSLYCWL